MESAAVPDTAASAGAEYDLTSELGKHLDRHLVFPLLEYLQTQGVYPEAEILQAKIDLLQLTNMVDFALDIHASLHGADAPSVGAPPRCRLPPALTPRPQSWPRGEPSSLRR
jgi:translation initiation factor 3 subunit E